MAKKENLDTIKQQLEKASKNIDLKGDKPNEKVILKAEIIKEQNKTISEWKNQQNEQIDIKEFDTAKELINVTIKGFNTATILTGEGGIGKTYLTVERVKECLKPTEWEYESGYTTPLAFYKYLYHNKDKKLLIVDDIEGIFDNKKSIAILKNALWDIDGKRMVYYDSTSDKLDVPNVFELKANLIILCNKIPNTKDRSIQAMISRAIHYEVNFSYEQKITIIKKIIEIRNIDKELKEKVITIIEKETNISTANFNIRTMEKLISLVRYNPDKADSLFKEITEDDDALVAYFDCQKVSGSENDRIKKFKELTGMSRATYFNIKKKYKSLIKKTYQTLDSEVKMKEFNIKFRCNTIDSEEIRECIEDNLGVEILEINEK